MNPFTGKAGRQRIGNCDSTALLKAVRNTIRADSDPHRQALFATLKKGSAAARFAAGLHARLGVGRASTLLVSTYGLRAFLAASASAASPPRPLFLTVAVHANARRQVNRVVSWFPGERASRLDFATRGVFSIGALGRVASLAFSPRRVAAALRIIHRVNARGNFLVSCRVACALACYARARSIIAKIDPRGIVVSSDTNPEELGFSSAARTLGTPTIYIAHAYPPPYVPVLDHSLAFLEGASSRDERLRRGSTGGTVFLLGFEGPSRVMDTARLGRANPVVGVFTPKNVSWPKLAKVLTELRSHLKTRVVLIRWHPSMLDAPRLGEVLPDAQGVEEAGASERLQDVLSRCDWVISDPDSNVHLPVLKLGVPAVAVSGLGIAAPGRDDPFGFQSNRIVYTVQRIPEFKLDEVAAFYGGDWPARFARYDAAYLRDQQDIEAEAITAIRRTLNA